MQAELPNHSIFSGPSSTVFLVRPRTQSRKISLVFFVLSIGALLFVGLNNFSSGDSSLAATKAAARCCGQCGQTFVIGDPKANSALLRCCDACTYRYFPGLELVLLAPSICDLHHSFPRGANSVYLPNRLLVFLADDNLEYEL
jgi:hypothetical protein